MKKEYYFIFLLITFFLYPLPNQLNKFQSIDSRNVSFGFADSSGRFLLADKIDQLSKNSYYAVVSSGKIFKLDFIKEQQEKKESTGRQAAENFYNSGGFLFKSPYINLNSGKTYLVADSSYLSQHLRLSMEPVSYIPLAPNTTKQIENAKGKMVKSSWQIGKTDDGIILAIILFQTVKDTALASLVLMKDDLCIFEDYPGDLKHEYSVWRVDDGGEFDPRAINVIALFYSSNGYEIARTWAGEEGENSVFLVQKGNVFKPALEYYRYWVPE
jgi:hypothetical protein